MKKQTLLTLTIAFSLLIGCCIAKPTSVTVKGDRIISVAGNRNISGVHPHLTTYSHARVNGEYSFGNECGIGALAVWNDKMYMVNYAAHEPKGSEHNLYTIDKDLKMDIFEGSVGGTPAARMIHKESNQLLIGHYLIGADGSIRVIPIKEMPGRITAVARHLKNPESMVYYYDMEGKLYEVNVNTLAVTKLYQNPLPGWHGKGGYTAQGRLVLANNGENTGFESRKDWQVNPEGITGPENLGILAEFDGDNFNVVERRQFTDVTTKNGIAAMPNDNSPLWAMGWDKRSIRLKVLDNGEWSTFLLPKAAYNNDPSHGWFTEWPRIREVGNGEFMMDMHGMFYKFPKKFSARNSKGIAPISSHLRYIPDFCSWNGNLILATDESSIQGNPMTGQPQSGLWIGKKSEISKWGPKSGYGAIYINDKVSEGEKSLPYLYNGFDNRIAHIINHSNTPQVLTFEVDRAGTGEWIAVESIELKADEYKSYNFDKKLSAEWLRVVSQRDGEVTVALHYTTDDFVKATPNNPLFDGLAEITEKDVIEGKLYSNKINYNMSYMSSKGDFEFDKFDFTFAKGLKDTTAHRALKTKVYYSIKHQWEVKTPHPDSLRYLWDVDDASVILNTRVEKLRLPKGSSLYDNHRNSRVIREVESEREIANIHGTFYEVPLLHVGQEPLFNMIRPISSHNLYIDDFNTWNGLLVMSGVSKDAKQSNHIYKSDDNNAAVWCGAIDDLWALGKPVGIGGPWKNSVVKAGERSDKYIMTGYDNKKLTLSSNKDCEVELWIYINHYLDTPVLYKTISVKAGKPSTYIFPDAFSAHWIELESNVDCTATAEFIYN